MKSMHAARCANVIASSGTGRVVQATLSTSAIPIGAHNYAHSHFHDYVPPSWSRAPCTPVPRAMREYLHEHHERHHTDARTNLCTILLGFDYLASTVYEVPVGLPEPSSEVAGEAALFAPPPSKLAPAAAAGDPPDFGMQLNELLQALPAPAPVARQVADAAGQGSAPMPVSVTASRAGAISYLLC